MQDFARPVEGAPFEDLASARAAIKCGSDNPIVDRLPAWSHVRRDIGVKAFSICIVPKVGSKLAPS